MILLLLVSACAPKPAPPPAMGSSADAAAVGDLVEPALLAAVAAQLDAPAPPDVATVAAPPPDARAAGAPLPADARVLVNAWRVRHNAGVTRLQAGDAAGALVEARAAVDLAPPELRDEPLLLVAVAASQVGERVVEIEALARIGEGADVPWGVYYNGGIDAASAGRPDLAHRFAQAALTRGGDVADVAPLAVRTALRVRAYDDAFRAGALLPSGHPTRADLVLALILAGRCADAARLAPGVCG